MRDQVVQGQYVQVESSDTHDWIVGVLLVLDGDIGECVPSEGEVVVC